MIPPFSTWRRLERYLLRNHPQIWSMKLLGLHALVSATTAVLALVIWQLPQEMLLEHFYWVRAVFTFFSPFLLLAFVAFPSIPKQPLPFTGSRQPHALRYWYFALVFFSPILFASLMAQERIKPMTRGYDLNALSAVGTFCEQKPPDKDISLKKECVEAVSRSSGRPRDQIDQGAIAEALKLSEAVPDGLITHWSDLLLLVLSLIYGAPIFVLIDKDPITQKAAVGWLSLVPMLYIFFFWIFYLAYLENGPPDKTFTWRILTGSSVPLLFSLFYVIAYSGRRRSKMLTTCWGMVLVGFPALVLWIPLLLSSPEQRLLHQAILLGCLLLLAPWIQRTHDRVRALPL